MIKMYTAFTSGLGHTSRPYLNSTYMAPHSPSRPPHVSKVGSLVFDKDDDLAAEFVTAASNLRSFCYGIPEQVKYSGSAALGHRPGVWKLNLKQLPPYPPCFLDPPP